MALGYNQNFVSSISCEHMDGSFVYALTLPDLGLDCWILIFANLQQSYDP